MLFFKQLLLALGPGSYSSTQGLVTFTYLLYLAVAGHLLLDLPHPLPSTRVLAPIEEAPR